MELQKIGIKEKYNRYQEKDDIRRKKDNKK